MNTVLKDEFILSINPMFKYSLNNDACVLRSFSEEQLKRFDKCLRKVFDLANFIDSDVLIFNLSPEFVYTHICSTWSGLKSLERFGFKFEVKDGHFTNEFVFDASFIFEMKRNQCSLEEDDYADRHNSKRNYKKVAKVVKFKTDKE